MYYKLKMLNDIIEFTDEESKTDKHDKSKHKNYHENNSNVYETINDKLNTEKIKHK